MSIRVGLRHMRRDFAMYCPGARYIVCRIFCTYNLCSSIPNEELTAQLTSTYFLCIEQKEYLVASLASVYDLSTAPT